MNKNVRIFPIDKMPDQIRNPFIGLVWETSLAPEIIMACQYKDKVMKIVKDEAIFKERGSLIGWFYLWDIMPRSEEYKNLVHIAATKNYYKDLEL